MFQLPQLSTPTFSSFYPHIPYQAQLIDDINLHFDYRLGVHEVLLSGSVGSAKTLLMAHLGLKHCFEFPRATVLLGRQAMPDLRDTIYAKILEHLIGSVKSDGTVIKEGTDFGFADGRCGIWFGSGSQFISRSWRDKRFKRLGSLDLSAAIIEEMTENTPEFWPFYSWIMTRVGRLPHIPRSWVISASNPDAPSHPAYAHFEIGKRQSMRLQGMTPVDAVGLNKTRHVYFSRTRDNPFLPSWYIDNLERDLDPKMARRLVHGEWVEIASEVIYHAYSSANFRNVAYKVDHLKPIYISFDFNIGAGKPMSAALSQVEMRGGEAIFHFFADVVVEGADTEDLMEEMAGRGLLNTNTEYIVHGDATGGSRSTKSKTTDYDIISKYLATYRRPSGTGLDFQIDVPRSNPPLRTRHNTVNAYCKNERGDRRLFVYAGALMLDKGMRLTALKKGGQYIEDDGPGCPYQHGTTAIGYHIMRVNDRLKSRTGIRSEQIR